MMGERAPPVGPMLDKEQLDGPPAGATIWQSSPAGALYRRKVWQSALYLLGAAYCSVLATLTLLVAWDQNVIVLDRIKAYTVSLNTVLTVYGYLVRIAGLVLVAAVVCYEHANLSEKATKEGFRLEDVRMRDVVSSEQPMEAIRLVWKDRRVFPFIVVLLLWGQSAASKYTFIVGERTSTAVVNMTLLDNRGCGNGPCLVSNNFQAVNATGSIQADSRNDSFGSMFIGQDSNNTARYQHPIPIELFGNTPDGAASYAIINAAVFRTTSVCAWFASNTSCPSVDPAGYIQQTDNSTYYTFRGIDLSATLTDAPLGTCVACNSSSWSGNADVTWTGGNGNWEATVTNWRNATGSSQGIATTAAWTMLAPFWLANLDRKINATTSADVMPQLENAMSLFAIASAFYMPQATPPGIQNQPVTRIIRVPAIQGDKAPATVQAVILFIMAFICLLGMRAALKFKLALTTTQCVAAAAGLQVTRNALLREADGWKRGDQRFVLVPPPPADREAGDTVHLVPVWDR